jgi:DNA-binding NtrC family response regulator
VLKTPGFLERGVTDFAPNHAFGVGRRQSVVLQIAATEMFCFYSRPLRRTNTLISMKRILLVDDEPGILQALRIILTGKGYEVETAWSTKEAWGILDQDNFDLVVTDFNMPGMKGDELARLIKERWPKFPVVMLSGSVEILRASGRALPGVDALIGKPFNMIEFCGEIARLLEEASAFANRGSEAAWSSTRHGELAARVI